MRKLNKIILALCSLVLFSCGNGFNNAGESCISFTLPQVYSGEGSARAVQLDESAYYVVKCVNSKTQKVVFFSEDVIPGNVINIENVLAGSYTIDIQLYQKDKWSGFENTILQTSAKNTTCEVTAGETTNLEIKMPAPSYEGIMYTTELLPFCASNELMIAYSGGGFYILVDTAEKLPEKVKVTIECDGDSEAFLCETELFEFYSKEGVSVSVEDSELLSSFVENKKAFTCIVNYIEDQDKSYSVKVSSFVYDFVEDFENMKDFGSENVCIFYSDAIFGILLAEFDNGELFITKTKYPRIYMKYRGHKSETFDAKSYYFDSFNFEGNSVQFNEKLSFTSYEEDGFESFFGKTFQTFDDLKAALGEIFTKDVKINLVSSADSKRNTSVTLPAKYAACVNQWLNEETVVFPEPEDEPDEPDDPDNPPVEPAGEIIVVINVRDPEASSKTYFEPLSIKLTNGTYTVKDLFEVYVKPCLELNNLNVTTNTEGIPVVNSNSVFSGFMDTVSYKGYTYSDNIEITSYTSLETLWTTPPTPTDGDVTIEVDTSDLVSK